MKNGHLLICDLKRKETLLKMNRLELFKDCFKDIPNLEDLKNNSKRKKKIKK